MSVNIFIPQNNIFKLWAKRTCFELPNPKQTRQWTNFSSFPMMYYGHLLLSIHDHFTTTATYACTSWSLTINQQGLLALMQTFICNSLELWGLHLIGNRIHQGSNLKYLFFTAYDIWKYYSNGLQQELFIHFFLQWCTCCK